MSKDNQEQKAILIDLMNSEPLMTYARFFYSHNEIDSSVQMIEAYAKYHTEWHINNLKEVVCDYFKLKSCNKPCSPGDWSESGKCSNCYKENEDIEKIKQSITNAIDKYLKENVKHIK